MLKNFDFVGHRKTFALISGIIIAVGVLVNLIFGVELDISFKGGTLMTLNYTGTIDEAVATDAIDSVFDNATVQFSSNDLSDTQLINISLPEKRSLEQKTAMLESLQKALNENRIGIRVYISSDTHNRTYAFVVKDGKLYVYQASATAK